MVVIVLDDARADDLRFLPSVQELAERGTNYTRAFARFSLCTPSRVSMLTGNGPSVHGIRDNHGQAFDPTSTIAVWLQNAGYRTGLVGKYLNGQPRYVGWSPQPGWEFWRALYRHDDYGREQSSVLLAQSVEFIADTDPRPFFLYLAPPGPHGPLSGPPGVCDGPFPPMPHPPSFAEQYTGSSLETKRWPQRLSSLCGIDILIRGVVAALEARGLLDRTVILVTSDQGYSLGERGEIGKQTLFEEVVRVPLVVAGPGFAPGESRRIVSLVDIAPTLADLAGAAHPPIEGRSIFSGVERNYAPIETSHCTGKRRARSKLATCAGVTVRYDLNVDPYEMTPLVGGGPVA